MFLQVLLSDASGWAVPPPLAESGWTWGELLPNVWQ